MIPVPFTTVQRSYEVPFGTILPKEEASSKDVPPTAAIDADKVKFMAEQFLTPGADNGIDIDIDEHIRVADYLGDIESFRVSVPTTTYGIVVSGTKAEWIIQAEKFTIDLAKEDESNVRSSLSIRCLEGGEFCPSLNTPVMSMMDSWDQGYMGFSVKAVPNIYSEVEGRRRLSHEVEFAPNFVEDFVGINFNYNLNYDVSGFTVNELLDLLGHVLFDDDDDDDDADESTVRKLDEIPNYIDVSFDAIGQTLVDVSLRYDFNDGFQGQLEFGASESNVVANVTISPTKWYVWVPLFMVDVGFLKVLPIDLLGGRENFYREDVVMLQMEFPEHSLTRGNDDFVPYVFSYKLFGSENSMVIDSKNVAFNGKANLDCWYVTSKDDSASFLGLDFTVVAYCYNSTTLEITLFEFETDTTVLTVFGKFESDLSDPYLNLNIKGFVKESGLIALDVLIDATAASSVFRLPFSQHDWLEVVSRLEYEDGSYRNLGDMAIDRFSVTVEHFEQHEGNLYPTEWFRFLINGVDIKFYEFEEYTLYEVGTEDSVTYRDNNSVFVNVERIMIFFEEKNLVTVGLQVHLYAGSEELSAYVNGFMNLGHQELIRGKLDLTVSSHDSSVKIDLPHNFLRLGMNDIIGVNIHAAFDEGISDA